MLATSHHALIGASRTPRRALQAGGCRHHGGLTCRAPAHHTRTAQRVIPQRSVPQRILVLRNAQEPGRDIIPEDSQRQRQQQHEDEEVEEGEEGEREQEEEEEAAFGAIPPSVPQAVSRDAASATSVGSGQQDLTYLPADSATIRATGAEQSYGTLLGSSSSSSSSSAMTGSWPRSRVRMLSGRPFGTVSFAANMRNTVILSGCVACDPIMAVDSSKKKMVEIIICPFDLPGDYSFFTKAVRVQAWGRLAVDVIEQLEQGDMVQIDGFLSHDEASYVNPYGGAPITVVASNVARVDIASISSKALTHVYDGVFDKAFKGKETAMARQDFVAWSNGATLRQLAAPRGMQLGAAAKLVLKGRELTAGSTQAGAPPLPFDWQRLLQELGVGSELLAAIKEGLEEHSAELDKKGRVLKKPVREYLLAHPVTGAMVRAQEAAAEGQNMTYRQIEAVRAGVILGAL